MTGTWGESAKTEQGCWVGGPLLCHQTSPREDTLLPAGGPAWQGHSGQGRGRGPGGWLKGELVWSLTSKHFFSSETHERRGDPNRKALSRSLAICADVHTEWAGWESMVLQPFFNQQASFLLIQMKLTYRPNISNQQKSYKNALPVLRPTLDRHCERPDTHYLTSSPCGSMR